jgi:hypothetical protein
MEDISDEIMPRTYFTLVMLIIAGSMVPSGRLYGQFGHRRIPSRTQRDSRFRKAGS